jgi:hypothetical protein
MPGRSLRDEMQGVAPVRSYGAPLGAQTPAQATDRPKVGPASAATQHAALESAGLYRKPVGSQASSPPVRRPAAPPPQQATTDSATRDLSVATAADRIRANPARINQAIDEQSK